MKVLIGTPIHESKDYSMERWIKSVSKFNYPFNLLMVDNSDNSEYVNKVNQYCKKYKLTNYKLVHVDVKPNSSLDEKLSVSREVIRQEILKNKYDAWCSIECDVIAPPDAITKLVDLIDDYWMVSHGYPARGISNDTNAEFGLSLITKKCLTKIGFIKQYGFLNPQSPTSCYSSDVWFIRQIINNLKGKYIHVYGIIKPIYHLNN